MKLALLLLGVIPLILSQTLFVDPSFIGTNTGSQSNPFTTLDDALDSLLKDTSIYMVGGSALSLSRTLSFNVLITSLTPTTTNVITINPDIQIRLLGNLTITNCDFSLRNQSASRAPFLLDSITSSLAIQVNFLDQNPFLIDCPRMHN